MFPGGRGSGTVTAAAGVYCVVRVLTVLFPCTSNTLLNEGRYNTVSLSEELNWFSLQF